MTAEDRISGDIAVLRMPELGLEDVCVLASAWLKSTGLEVVEGERLLELVAGEVTVDLPAPTSGRLVQQLVEEDQQLHPGQALAVIAHRRPGVGP